MKFNIPEQNNLTQNDYKGQIYLGYSSNNKSQTNQIIELKAINIMNDWHNTKVTINPFIPFTINAGTYTLSGSQKYISSIGNIGITKDVDCLLYDFLETRKKSITSTPLILKNYNTNNILTIYKSGKTQWDKGELYLSFLSWGNKDKGKDQFSYFENKINNANKTVSVLLNNKYLSKIFIGSIGHRFYPNDHFIYFGHEGTNLEELDPLKKRISSTLPYGYLIGKLGEKGAPFPIGTGFISSNNNVIPVYSQDKNNNFYLTVE